MENEGEAANFARLAQQWCRSNASWEKGHDEELYLRQIVDYVDRSASWQRVGEGQRIRLRDILGVLEYGKRWDVWGIPSTLAILYVAGVIHERIFRPYWPRIKVELIDLWKKTVEILDQRVWVPVKGAL
jgi:nuclear-control-of-ATPase protein 2